MENPEEELFTPFYQFESIGGWIGMCACKRCGAAILLEKIDSPKDFDASKCHTDWHKNGINTLNG